VTGAFRLRTLARIFATPRRFTGAWLLAILLVAATLFGFPQVVASPYALHLMIILFLSVAMGESWNIIGGYCGQYSVGHAAYFGVGSYAALMLLQYKHVEPWWGVWGAMAAALIVAVIWGVALAAVQLLDEKKLFFYGDAPEPGVLHRWDALRGTERSLALKQDPACAACANAASYDSRR